MNDNNDDDDDVDDNNNNIIKTNGKYTCVYVCMYVCAYILYSKFYSYTRIYFLSNVASLGQLPNNAWISINNNNDH